MMNSKIRHTNTSAYLGCSQEEIIQVLKEQVIANGGARMKFDTHYAWTWVTVKQGLEALNNINVTMTYDDLYEIYCGNQEDNNIFWHFVMKID